MEQRLNLSRSYDKHTLMLTTPCSLLKSSTMDLSLSIFEIVIQHTQLDEILDIPRSTLQFYDVGYTKAYLSLFAKHRER
jgi:hypothetical protein